MAEKNNGPKKIEGYKKLLVKIKDDILHDIRNMSSASMAEGADRTNESGHAMHMADVATDMYDREFNLGLASNDRELLNKVDVALQRIEDGTFGVCSVCKKSIKAARLKAIPYVETCLECQEELENKRS